MDKKQILVGLLSRKFLFSVLVIALSYVALMLGRLDSGSWVGVVSLALGVYASSNVMQKHIEQKTAANKEKKDEEGSV